MNKKELHRLLGDTPGRLALRLLALSFIVGMVLSAFDLTPLRLVEETIELFAEIWERGFAALGWFGEYLAIGAVVVIPLWLIARISSLRSGE
ncbi:DUF6460 domain-containing protein [Polycladidibacter hongkongensis]|uniref:DUF6460 domain-containing protein n=1 Tax=Polycladidibacter hongkongensis TaxID=1647556 RepID=UPI00082A9595|nr:DUF6460 domain-containing protein [Pseudovibrio hongkongensis]